QRQRVDHPIPQYPTRREAANVVGSASTTTIGRSPSSPSSFPPARHGRLRQASRCFSMCLPARRSRTLTHVVMDRQLQFTSHLPLSSAVMTSRSSYEARSRAVHVRAAIVTLAHDRADVADTK